MQHGEHGRRPPRLRRGDIAAGENRIPVRLHEDDVASIRAQLRPHIGRGEPAAAEVSAGLRALRIDSAADPDIALRAGRVGYFVELGHGNEPAAFGARAAGLGRWCLWGCRLGHARIRSTIVSNTESYNARSIGATGRSEDQPPNLKLRPKRAT